MGKFEYYLVGVMGFLTLGILGLIATSPDSDVQIKDPNYISESKSIMTFPINSKANKTESKMTEENTVKQMNKNVHLHEIIISNESGIPGCEKTNECFIPTLISISSGHTVMWINKDVAAHTVTSGFVTDKTSGKIFDSGLVINDKTFEYTFSKSGSYDYFCLLHPWMIGTVNVV